MDVTQTVSLSHAYKPAELSEALQAKAGKGKLGGQKVENQGGGTERAFKVKSGWERFTSRVAYWQKHSSSLSTTDTGADTLALRFNKRHQEYSGKIANVVSRLKGGETADIHKDVLATLRNDVKWMNKNASWAGRTDLLATRMDVELSQLSNDDLAKVADSLKDAHKTKGLTTNDKADVRTMQRAVVRAQLSRSEELKAVLTTINADAPSTVSNATDLLDKLATAGDFVKDKLKEFGIETAEPHTGPYGSKTNPVAEHINGDILSGAIRSAVSQPPHNTKLEGLNKNLLNVERALHKATVMKFELLKIEFDQFDVQETREERETREVAFKHPELRALSRAVREEFLKTKVETFTDDNLRSRMKVLGQGAAHEVCKGTYKTATQKDGVSMVHKYDDDELVHPSGGRFGAPDALGIDQSNPRLLERAVFTSALDKHLGFGVSVGTSFALHHDQLGIVMELAPGKTASGVKVPSDRPQAKAQQELIKLQLLDIITGQADRHNENYMVAQGENGEIIGVKAIDSDFCMGPEPDDSNKIAGKHAVHLPYVPPVVDTEMLKAIKELRPEDLADLGGGMFDDDSIRAAQGRLQALKDHVGELEKGNGGKVIDPKDWGTDEVNKLLSEARGPSYKTTVKTSTETKEQIRYVPTSYWQREHSRANLKDPVK